MALTSSNKTATMSARMRKFAHLWATGPPGIKGNGPAAFRAAGYHPRNDNVASASASRMLKNVNVQAEIARLHAEADAQAIAQLRDWRVLAPPAQSRIQSISLGYLPDHLLPTEVRPIQNRDDAAVARVMLEASTFIVERAYPSKMYASDEARDPERALAALLGISRYALPRPQNGTSNGISNGGNDVNGQQVSAEA